MEEELKVVVQATNGQEAVDALKNTPVIAVLNIDITGATTSKRSKNATVAAAIFRCTAHYAPRTGAFYESSGNKIDWLCIKRKGPNQCGKCHAYRGAGGIYISPDRLTYLLRKLPKPTPAND